MNRTIPRPTDRDEWLAARRPYFNASAASVLWDRHPFLTPGDYATTKLTGREQTQTRAMQRGLRLEDVIAQWWADDNRCKVVEPDHLYVRGPIMATVDRVVTGCDTPAFPVGTPIEIKNPGHRVREPELHWLDQCQAIMYAAAAPEMVLVWFDSSMEIHERSLFADEDFAIELADKAEQFMAAIELGIVPDWITLSYDNAADLYPNPAGRLELDDHGLDLVQKLDVIRQIRRDAEADERKLRDQLAGLLLDCEAGAWRGQDIVTWKATKSTMVVDVKRLAEENPDLAARYLTERPGSRRMLVHLGAE